MKRRMIYWLAVLVAMMTLTTCWTVSAVAESSNLAGEISITSWNSSYTAIVAGAEKFMEEHPEAKISVEQVSDNTKLYTQLATNTGVPDIMQFQNRDMQTVLAKYPDSFLDVTDVMQPKENDIVPAVLPLCKDGDTYYAIPWDIAPAMMFYRKDIFEANGIDASTIYTWDDLLEAGKIINTNTQGKTKIFGFDYNGASSFDMPLILFYEQGGSFFDENGNANFNSDATRNAYLTVKKFVDADVSLNLPSEWTDRITALANDQLCAVPYGVWFAGTLEENLADQAGLWAVMPLPALEKGGPNQANSGGSVVMVSSQTKYPELCKAFLDWFLLQDEGNAINMSVSTLFDAYIPSYQDPSYTNTDDYFGMSVAQFATTVCGEIPTLPFPAYFTDVGVVFQNEAIGQYFIDGGDLNAVLDAATASAQSQLEFLKSE
ncbi:MAG: extracellular solute-binding protein [Eubacteriales bacterium]|nr:extracellular solute-binding protein [Eubacteriales bacterium]